SKTSTINGLFARREELPPPLRSLGRDPLKELADRALKRQSILQAGLCTAPTRKVLDVPGGPVAKNQGYQDGGSWRVDWSEYGYDPITQMVRERSTISSEMLAKQKGSDA